MTQIVIRVEDDFTPFPGGRYRTDGEFSGEQFREEFLRPALDRGDKVIVILDGVEGYPSSFLEEAFGGLIRAGLSLSFLRKQLVVRSDDPHFDTYRLLTEKYLRDAAKEQVRHQ